MIRHPLWVPITGQLLQRLRLHDLTLAGPSSTRLGANSVTTLKGTPLRPWMRVRAGYLPQSDADLPHSPATGWCASNIADDQHWAMPTRFRDLFGRHPHHHALPFLANEPPSLNRVPLGQGASSDTAPWDRPGRRQTALDTLEGLADHPALQEILLGVDFGRFNVLNDSAGPQKDWRLKRYSVQSTDVSSPGYTHHAAGLRASTVRRHVSGAATVGVFGWEMTTWACIDIDIHDAEPGPIESHRIRVDELITAVRKLLQLFPNAMIEARYDSPEWPATDRRVRRQGTGPWCPCYRLQDGTLVHRHPYDHVGVIKGVHLWIRFLGWYFTEPLREHLKMLCSRVGVGVDDRMKVEVFPQSGHSIALPMSCGQIRLGIGRSSGYVQYELVDQNLLPRVLNSRMQGDGTLRFTRTDTYLNRMWACWQAWHYDVLPGAQRPMFEIPSDLWLGFKDKDPPAADHPSYRSLHVLMDQRPRIDSIQDASALRRVRPKQVDILVPSMELLYDHRPPDMAEFYRQVEAGVMSIAEYQAEFRRRSHYPAPERTGAKKKPMLGRRRATTASATDSVRVSLPDDPEQRRELEQPLGAYEKRNDRTLRIVRYVQDHNGELTEAEGILIAAMSGGGSQTSLPDALKKLKDAWERSAKWRSEKGFNRGRQPLAVGRRLTPAEVRRLRQLIEVTVGSQGYPAKRKKTYIRVTLIILRRTLGSPEFAQRYVLGAQWLREEAGSYDMDYKRWLLDRGCQPVAGERAAAYDVRPVMKLILEPNAIGNGSGA